MKKNELGGSYSAYRAEEKCVEVLFGKRKGKRPFGRFRLRWEDIIKTNLQVVERGHELH
jgi:hypothetical protein